MRLFRTIILFAGIATLMPAPPEDAASPARQQEEAAVSTPDVIAAAGQAASDVGSFCLRQPGVCETASYVAARLEAKAKYGVRLIYEWAAESSSEPHASPVADQAEFSDPIATGSTRLARSEEQPSSTLTIEDLIPEWQEPIPPRKG
jgi:hypothetical protein